MFPDDLSVLVFPEPGGRWTACGMEYDVAVQARSMDDAIDGLIRILQAHVEFDVRHGRRPLSAFSPAPRLFADAFRFAASRESRLREMEIPGTGPTSRVRVAIVQQSPMVYALCRTA